MKFKVKLKDKDTERERIDENVDALNEDELKRLYEMMGQEVIDIMSKVEDPIQEELNKRLVEGNLPVAPNIPTPLPAISKYMNYEDDGIKFRFDTENKILEKLDWKKIEGEDLKNYGTIKLGEHGEDCCSTKIEPLSKKDLNLYRLSWIPVKKEEEE